MVIFDGFLKVYEEGRDDNDSKEDGKSLPKLFQNEQLEKLGVNKDQHFTQPPPRYTEATFVKKMEELGIGRPSTYASIVTTIQEREYVRKEKTVFRRRIKADCNNLFIKLFKKYIEYDFTAGLEEKLDIISAGKLEYTNVLKDFWQDFSFGDIRNFRTSYYSSFGCFG